MMSTRVRWIGSIAAVVVLGFAAGGENTASAQSRNVEIRTSHGNRTEIRWTEGGRTTWIRSEGNVEFTDDDRDVRRISPGGRLSIEQRGWESVDRRIEYMGLADGAVQRTYLENGRAATLDGQAQSWVNRMILILVRERTVGAEPRARRILARGGVSAMLSEIEQIRSSSAKRIYYNVLLEQSRLSAGDLTRILSSIGRDIPSSSDKARLLQTVAGRANLSGNVGRAFFEAAGSIPSSSDRRSVLLAALDRPGLDEEGAAALLRAAEGIPSGSDKAAVLLRGVERVDLARPRARDAFFAAAGSIPSSSDRRRVLSAALRQPNVSKPTVLAVLRAVEGIPSDSEKTAVLLEVPDAQLRDTQIASAYVATLQSIRSDGNYRRAASRVMQQRTR
jgi:hypothetical protein